MSSHGGRLYPEERREALAPDMPGACQQGIRRWKILLNQLLADFSDDGTGLSTCKFDNLVR
jgi:hypothetical protein